MFRSGAVWSPQHAGLPHAGMRDTELLQFFLDPLCGTEFLQAHLRMPVEFPANGNQVFFFFRKCFL